MLSSVVWVYRNRKIHSPLIEKLKVPFIFWSNLAIGVFLIGPKPTGRYLETLFLISITLLVPIWAATTSLVRWSFLCWPVFLVLNVFYPAASASFDDREFRFWIFHDRSRDFLPKQESLLPLQKIGCHPSQVESGDPRIQESIRFILQPKKNSETTCDTRRFSAKAGANQLIIEETSP